LTNNPHKEDARTWYRISDLERLSGISRRTIHFYFQQGLLPAPLKTGKTMAYYNHGHLERLEAIQAARKKGMPIAAIKEQLPPDKTDNKADAATSAVSGKQSKASRKPDKTGDIRESILEWGSYLFRQKGYKDTTVTDITRALNIGKGSFYFYFKDKKALLLECVPRISEALFSQGWERIRREKDPLKRLELRAQTVFPVLPEFCAIIQLCKEAIAHPDPKVKRLGQQTFLSIRKPLEADIEKGIQKGLFRDVDPKIAGSMMIGIIENMYYLKAVDQSMAHAAIWDQILDLLISGIKK
jgi:AcrR family transcriptional regulator